MIYVNWFIWQATAGVQMQMVKVVAAAEYKKNLSIAQTSELNLETTTAWNRTSLTKVNQGPTEQDPMTAEARKSELGIRLITVEALHTTRAQALMDRTAVVAPTPVSVIR